MSPLLRRTILGTVAAVAAIILTVTLILKPDEEVSTQASIVPRADCPVDQLPCLDGDTVPAVGEKPTIVTLWAWWCGPCREELPLFDEFAAAHPEYTVIGAHADPNAAAGSSFAHDIGLTIPSLQDSDRYYASTYELPDVIPITLFFRPDGSLAGKHLGPYVSLNDLERDAQDALK